MEPYRYDILCTGTALVDSIIRGLDPNPVSPTGFRADSGTLNVGGEAVNEAVAAARLGARTGILCYLGEDAAGGMVKDLLDAAGVSTDAIAREAATPVSTLLVNMDGTRRSITNGAHRHNFHPERFGETLSKARAVTLGSLFRAPYDDPEVLHDTIMAAGDAVIFADTKLPNFRRLTLADVADSLKLVDYILPNEDEARFYTGEDDPDAQADALLAHGVKNVIIKLGTKGCLLKNATGRIRLDSLPVRAVDATGAGDQFLAGFATELLRGAGQEEALRFANACGAICCTAIGACTALRSREQVLDLLKTYA